jgi:hypothetical protein
MNRLELVNIICDVITDKYKDEIDISFLRSQLLYHVDVFDLSERDFKFLKKLYYAEVVHLIKKTILSNLK